MPRNASCACLAAWLSLVAVSAAAQPPAPAPLDETVAAASADPPAHIAVVDGRATLERDGQPEASPLSMPLLAGDRLRTDEGRVEVLFADGAALHLDASSAVDFQSDDLIRLLSGRVRLIIPGPRRALSYRIDAPGGWVQIAEPGEYRVAVTRGPSASQVELVVLRGTAELMNEDGRTDLRAGERALARAGEAPSYAYVYNSAAWDAFDRWSDSRRSDRAGASAQYLPETVQSYSSTFDRYGSWRRDDTYGEVWYPTVSAGWRPYFSGRWASYPGYGWTWIGTDAWSWPTHHYGRWGFSAGAWFWIPGRTWGPAWVSWAYAPGYVSWCPLGWDNRAVLQFGRTSYGGRYDHWNAWTVVANGRFGSGYINSGYLGGGRIDGRTRESFVLRSGGPQIRGYATARQVAPIRVAGSRGPGGYGYGGNDRGLTTGGDRGLTAGDRGLAAGGARGRMAPAGGDRAARGPVGSEPRNARGAAAAGTVRTDPGAGAVRSRATIGPETMRSATRDEAAAFRDRRPQTGASSGAGYPAPARAPRDTPDVVQRMGAPRERTAAPRTFDPATVPVYRGGERSPAAPERRADDRQPDVYRRNPAAAAPAGAQPAPRPWPNDDRRQAPASGYERPTSVDRGDSQRQPDPYRAMPRQPSAPSTPPAYRPYGGEERRPAPGPAAAPPREPAGGGGGGAPRGPAPSSGAGQSRERPQGAPDRGTAVRRGGGRG